MSKGRADSAPHHLPREGAPNRIPGGRPQGVVGRCQPVHSPARMVTCAGSRGAVCASPGWVAHAGVKVGAQRAVITSVFFDAADAFGDGILAGAPAASGTFTWPVQ